MKYDALIVLGKNVGYLGSSEKIRKTKNHLSRKSELNVLAAGYLYQAGDFNKLIFSGGKSVGKNYPSEAEAMSDFLREKFPRIPNSAVLLEDKSLDTLQNSLFVKQILEKDDLHKLAILTTKAHMPRSLMLFERLKLKPYPFISEETIIKYSPKLFEIYRNEFNQSEIVAEKLAIALQSIPLISSIGNLIIQKRRGLN